MSRTSILRYMMSHSTTPPTQRAFLKILHQSFSGCHCRITLNLRYFWQLALLWWSSWSCGCRTRFELRRVCGLLLLYWKIRVVGRASQITIVRWWQWATSFTNITSRCCRLTTMTHRHCFISSLCMRLEKEKKKIRKIYSLTLSCAHTSDFDIEHIGPSQNSSEMKMWTYLIMRWTTDSWYSLIVPWDHSSDTFSTLRWHITPRSTIIYIDLPITKKEKH